MEPQIQVHDAPPNVTITTGGMILMLRYFPGEVSAAGTIVQYDSTYLQRSPLPLARPQVVAITIDDIMVDGRAFLRRKTPLELVAQRNDAEGTYHTDFPDLDVPLVGYSREDLISEAHVLIASTWRRCIGVDEAKLAPLAIRLKGRLLAEYDEVE